MSIANEFDATKVRISEEDRVAYVMDEYGGIYKFKFDFTCSTVEPVRAVYFFDIEKKRVMIVDRDINTKMLKCFIVGFVIRNDNTPSLLVNRYVNQESTMSAIYLQFQEKYFAYIVDSAINE